VTRATTTLAAVAITAVVVIASHRCPSRPPAIHVHPVPIDLRPVLRELVAASDDVALDVAEIEARCYMVPHRLTVAHVPPRLKR